MPAIMPWRDSITLSTMVRPTSFASQLFLTCRVRCRTIIDLSWLPNSATTYPKNVNRSILIEE